MQKVGGFHKGGGEDWEVQRRNTRDEKQMWTKRLDEMRET
jgi:hypothetical protein